VYKNQIEALRINGHTSSEWKNTKFTNKYLNNEELSMQRSYETLKSLFLQQSRSKQDYLSKILQGSGINYQAKIMTHKKEDKEKSRRVSFQIILH
jgi:outer membrane protein OmpA-like peptidoglycan-associated protein